MVAFGVIMIIGMTFFIAGYIIYKIGRHIPYDGQTDAVVIDTCLNATAYNNGRGGNTNIGVSNGTSAGSRHPVYEYKVDGRVYRRASLVAYNASTACRMVGNTKTAYFDSANPEKFSPQNNFLWKIGLVLLCIGVGAIFISIAILFVTILAYMKLT